MKNKDFYRVPIDPVELSFSINRIRSIIESSIGYEVEQEVLYWIKNFVDNLIETCNINEEWKSDEKLRQFVEQMATTFIMIGHEAAMVKMETGFLTMMDEQSKFDN